MTQPTPSGSPADADLPCAPIGSGQPARSALDLGPIAGELADVRRRLIDEMQLNHPALAPLGKHIAHRPGKMLRPAILLLSAQSVGLINNQHMILATIVELLHQATLVHDDVLDQAELRRSRPTVNRLWGNEAGVLLGDWLLSRAFTLAGKIDDRTITDRLAAAANEVCHGELTQCLNRYNWNLTEDEYFTIIRQKTATLYRLCAELGARCAGGNETQVGALSAYGEDVGLAFQMADDLLDVSGSEAVAGKTLGSDLAQGKVTLPLIHALNSCTDCSEVTLPELLSRLLPSDAAADDRVINQIIALLKKTGSLEYTRTRADGLSQRACQSLSSPNLPDTPARASLISIAQFVVERSW